MDELNAPSFIPQEPQRLSIEEVRVGFGRRLGAFFLDGAITMIISTIFMFTMAETVHQYSDAIMGAPFEAQGQSLENLPSQLTEIMQAFMGIIFVSSFVGIVLSLLEVFTGASVGKMLLSMQAGHANGARGNLVLWAKRWAVKHLSSIVSIVVMFYPGTVMSLLSGLLGFAFFIGCFFCLAAHKQALHDLIAKTAVFKNDDLIPE